MNNRLFLTCFFLLLCSMTSFAQQADDVSLDTDDEQTQNKDEKNSEAERPYTPPPPKPTRKGFKPTTEISDDSAVAFPVDI